MPRSAATDFARRNKKSGISRVVFTIPYYHIYGTTGRLNLTSGDRPLFGRRLLLAMNARARLLTGSSCRHLTTNRSLAPVSCRGGTSPLQQIG
jgi:hypothetical protein